MIKQGDPKKARQGVTKQRKERRARVDAYP